MTLINGSQQESISVHDRALHYGDGLFETFAVKNDQVLAWDQHISRLQTGCRRLGIPCPDITLLNSEASILCEGQERAVLKLILSRGEGGRAYTPPAKAECVRIFSVHPWPDYPAALHQTGIEAGILQTRLGCNPSLAGIKHLNRLEQVMLQQELSKTTCSEAIVLNINDEVIEGTMSNLFVVKNNKLYTPDLANSGIAGVVRACILELASRINLKTEIKAITLDEVLSASEIFFCNSIAGIWPVNKIEHNSYEIGTKTKKLQHLLSTRNLIALI